MSDLLAIFGAEDCDRELLAEITAVSPERITVLLEDSGAECLGQDSPAGDAVRDRLARLMAEIERQTGATVVGLTGDQAQLAGWSFDRRLSARTPVLA